MFCTCLLFYYHNIVKSIASMDNPNLVIEVLITTLHNVLKSYLLIQFCTWVSTNTIFHTSPVIKLLFMKQTTIIYHFSIVNISKCIHVFTICIFSEQNSLSKCNLQILQNTYNCIHLLLSQIMHKVTNNTQCISQIWSHVS